MGPEGVKACLNAGVNDLGGTLINESITRAAGTAHGQEMRLERMEALIRSVGRVPHQRSTLYETSNLQQTANPTVTPNPSRWEGCCWWGDDSSKMAQRKSFSPLLGMVRVACCSAR